MNRNDLVYGFSGPLKPERVLGGIDDLRTLVHQIGLQACCVHLGIHRTTLMRWLAGGRDVPRYAVMSLYWHSSWGRALVDSDHMRALNILYNEIAYLRKERDALRKSLAEMEKYGDFDSANSPVFKVE